MDDQIGAKPVSKLTWGLMSGELPTDWTRLPKTQPAKARGPRAGLSRELPGPGLNGPVGLKGTRPEKIGPGLPESAYETRTS